MAERLLLVEDTPSLSMLYRSVLTKSGHGVACAFNLAEARAQCEKVRPSLVLLDLQLPDGDGLDLLASLRREAPETRTIVITANGSINRAVQAMRAGAFDFLVKPFDEARLLSAVGNALASAPDHPDEEGTAFSPAGFQGFIGGSAAMQEIYRMIRSIGRSTATVFITGESGTGKEVAARAIHAMSTRAAKPFVPLNCAAIPRDLLESEVFGHLKGAFTGALSDKPGAAAVADGGTLVPRRDLRDGPVAADQAAALPADLDDPAGRGRAADPGRRAHRLCDEPRPGRGGSAGPLPRGPLLPPARGADPHAAARGRGRTTSWTSPGRACPTTPPRRERRFTGFDPEAAAILTTRTWPGNVRQLLNVIRNTVVLHDGPLVRPEMLPAEIAGPAAPPGIDRVTQIPMPVVNRGARDSSTRARIELLVGTPLADVERELIEATIAHCDGSIPRAAKILAVSPSTLYRKLESWTGAQRRSGT